MKIYIFSILCLKCPFTIRRSNGILLGRAQRLTTDYDGCGTWVITSASGHASWREWEVMPYILQGIEAREPRKVLLAAVFGPM